MKRVAKHNPTTAMVRLQLTNDRNIKEAAGPKPPTPWNIFLQVVLLKTPEFISLSDRKPVSNAAPVLSTNGSADKTPFWKPK